MIRPERWMSAEFLFLCGVLSLPAFLFGEAVWAKTLLMAVYILLNVISGRKVKVLPNLVAAAGIVAANLFTPFGRILFRIGTFPVTEGAFRVGLTKSATIIGLIYLSRFTIRSTIRIPGRVGEVFSLMLFYFERITEQKIKFERKNPWIGLDGLLESVYRSEGGESGADRPKTATCPAGYAFAGCFVLLNWTIFFVERLMY